MPVIKTESQSTVNILKVYLSECSFNRLAITSGEMSMDIQRHSRAVEGEVNQFETTIKVILKLQDSSAPFCIVSMVGLFVAQGDFPNGRESFEKINAPAIVYPHIRQLVRYLSIEAGDGQLLLPIINFEQLP